jgi:2-C-methyl-D-erythritol 2,4-cyclodiphosphate synthase
MRIRTGIGYDVHAFAEGRPLWLGGVKIEHPRGLAGHSDADVLIHAICDALLGAANLGDIGLHFPDTAAEYRDIDSKILLSRTMEMLRMSGYELGNVDATIVAEQPILRPYIPAMQQTLAEVMQVDPDDLSIKATTSEKLGFTGRGEGIAACASVLLTDRIAYSET